MNLRCTLLLLLVPAFTGAVAQSPLSAGHYVVIASYLQGQETYAQKYADKMSKEGTSALYGYDATRKMYYVYTEQNSDFNESIKHMMATREKGFPTAWVRVMKTSSASPPNQPVVEVKKEETKPTPPVPEVKKEAPTPVAVVTPPETSVQKQEPVVVADTKPFVPTIDNPPADPVYRPQILTNTPVFLSLYDPSNKSVVEGDVEVVDKEHARLLQKVKGNDYLHMPDPGTKSGQLSLISTSFGYREVEHDLNYKSTEKDTLESYVSLVGNYYMISFEMVRLRKGDIKTLFNVYFYNDAAIMLPESSYELNKLLAMMKANPAYRIMLHGHTNGHAAGSLITRGPSNNFFEITTDVKRGIGSAKDLSRERAQIIKDWLVSNGVAADRMDIKAWGGQRMIHDKNGPHARKNVRVEVEVLQD
jgi:outer membrane protein OmpA-like peptidoglycan-associated protein